ncbi:MAG: GspH/FimT family pseudopilin, partial [Desulfobacteraceae bacterium]
MILKKFHSPYNKGKMRSHQLSDKNGFTLIELMVTVAIIGIVASFAISSLNNLLPRYRVKSAARQVRADLQDAKMEAVKQNRTVLVDFNVAGSGNPGSCITCFDTDSDDDCDDEAAGDIITSLDLADYPQSELINPGFTNGNHFRFNSRGLPESDSGGLS